MKQHTAKLNHLRISPRKVRLVADLIRGLSVNEAEAQLLMQKKRASEPLLKLLRSAVAGAEEKEFQSSALVIDEIRVDQAPMLKRFRARAQGAAGMIQKRASHVTITLAEKEPQTKKFTIEKPVKSKPEKQKTKSKSPSKKRKPRPSDQQKREHEPKKKKGFFRKVFGN